MAILRGAVQASPAAWLAGAMLLGPALAGCASPQGGAAPASVSPASSAPAAAPAPAALPFDTIDQTATSRIESARTVVVRDARAWARLWAEHAGPDVPAPPVDFATRMVVGVFLGTRPSGCHATAIVGLERAGERIRVHEVDKVPGPTVRCMMMITTPAHLVATARSDLAVEFAVQTVEL